MSTRPAPLGVALTRPLTRGSAPAPGARPAGSASAGAPIPAALEAADPGTEPRLAAYARREVERAAR